MLKDPITILESRRGKPQLTNYFLLEHCKYSYQLFAVRSEQEYVLMEKLSEALALWKTNERKEPLSYRIGKSRVLRCADGFITLENDKGKALSKIEIGELARYPRVGFHHLKKHL